MMQYMDKLALSQATLFNLREDLVRSPVTRQTLYSADLLSEPPGLGLLVDVGRLLLWIPCMELAQQLPDGSPAAGEVPDCLRPDLGRRPDVPRSSKELWRLDGGAVLLGCGRGGHCSRVCTHNWHAIQTRGATSTVRRPITNTKVLV